MNRNRLQLLLIVAAFALPAVLAVLLQTRWFHWEPQVTRNRGDLIKPVLPLTTDAVSSALFANGQRWSVLVRFPEPCEAECERRLTLLSHVREAQGKEMERVQMIAWANVEQAPPWQVWQPTGATALTLAPGEAALVDPLGNAMLRYSAKADPTDVRQDLAHLLHWSKVGNE